MRKAWGASALLLRWCLRLLLLFALGDAPCRCAAACRSDSGESELLHRRVRMSVPDSHDGPSSERDQREFPRGLPLVINTWAWSSPTERAWAVLNSSSGSAGAVVDAVVEGCSVAESDLGIDSVGYGNHPDESGETTLDAMVIDGSTRGIGAVAGLRRIKEAIAVARAVLVHTHHTMLVGDAATKFAVSMGFVETSLATKKAEEIHETWLKSECQPNFWRNVMPDPSASCGPYSPRGKSSSVQSASRSVTEKHHDTIGMIAIDAEGRIAAGTSTNGAQFKIPGRVGDTAIPGAGAYVDPDVGAAAATGDGDVMMRFLPSLVAVEKMKLGATPYVAGVEALSRIARVHPDVKAAMVLAKQNGEFAGVCHGFEKFQYSVVNPGTETGRAEIIPVPCFSLDEHLREGSPASDASTSMDLRP